LKIRKFTAAIHFLEKHNKNKRSKFTQI